MKTEIRNQKSATRIKLWAAAAVVMAVLALSTVTGCKQFGADTSAPNAVEKQLFTTVTNYVAVPVQVSVTNYVTKEVTLFQTNTVGQIVTVTNEVPTPVYSVKWVTNEVPQYENTVSDRTKASVTGFGGILNYFFPGAGPIGTTGVLALLAAWAQLRSGKRQQTASALTQQMETVLEFIKTLPNGAGYKEAITGFLQKHQMEAGVADQVLSLIENQVSNKDAKAAVEEIKNSIKATQAVAQ
jgi:hypothetical protein